MSCTPRDSAFSAPPECTQATSPPPQSSRHWIQLQGSQSIHSEGCYIPKAFIRPPEPTLAPRRDQIAINHAAAGIVSLGQDVAAFGPREGASLTPEIPVLLTRGEEGRGGKCCETVLPAGLLMDLWERESEFSTQVPGLGF